MIVKLAALILLCTPSVIQTSEVPQLISLTVVDLGDNVTFGCEVSEKVFKAFNWYKQSLGHLPQHLASVVFNQINLFDELKDSRFTVNKEASQFIFTIRNVSKEDEATYFCQTQTTYSQMFSSGTFLAVKDYNQQESIYMKQIPKKESVLIGDSLALQCSLLSTIKEKALQCPDEHRVYWLRTGSERYTPSIIYTHMDNRDEALKRNCVYSLSKMIQNYSDAGTYYCAVVTCGKIMFGEGTKVEIKSVSEFGLFVLVLGVFLTSSMILSPILVFYSNRRNVCQRCTGKMIGSHHIGKSTVDQSNSINTLLNDKDTTTSCAALGFSRKIKMRRAYTECVYSVLKADNYT
uniref:Ig-like domain-containing protein n=1 Tax=Oreochromis aureus TaxID=47969 RepID=A0AAZ1X8A5_OREAU